MESTHKNTHGERGTSNYRHMNPWSCFCTGSSVRGNSVGDQRRLTHISYDAASVTRWATLNPSRCLILLYNTVLTSLFLARSRIVPDCKSSCGTWPR